MMAPTSKENEILESFRSGNREKGLKMIVSDYQTKLYNMALRILGDHDDAVDALQETLMAIDSSIHRFQGNSTLYTWIYRIAVNVCLNSRKKRKSGLQQERILDFLEPMARPEYDPDTMCVEAYRKYVLHKAIQTLPEEQRSVLVLHEWEGFSAKEIAAMLGLEIAAVKSRIHRAKERIRKLVIQELEKKDPEVIALVGREDSLFSLLDPDASIEPVMG